MTSAEYHSEQVIWFTLNKLNKLIEKDKSFVGNDESQRTSNKMLIIRGRDFWVNAIVRVHKNYF